MPTLRHNKTVYSEYVFSNVVSILSGAGAAYNISDLALAVGLKPTSNFKRRVNQMVSEGLIHSYPAFSPRGGMMKIYTTLTEVQALEIPF
jgi:hypothetical protein